jgi:hypothetical protein
VSGRSPVLILIAASLLAASAACSSDATTGTGGGSTTTSTVANDGTAPGTTAAVGGSAPSVPIVDPASVEAFCALDQQLDQLAEEQLGAVSIDDAEAFRRAMAAYVTDNAAVIDQYVAAAPPEIRSDVNAVTDQTRAAVDDPELFATLLSGTGDTAASNRVSAFIGANCPR